MSFEITTPYNVGDLSEVKEDRNLVPPTKGLKLRIAKASVQESKDKALAGVKLELRIVDGIQNAEGVAQYVNKPMFTSLMDLCFYANPEVKNSDWYKNKQHLVGFKQFVLAIGGDLKNVTVDDSFLEGLIGDEVLADVTHEPDTIADPEGKLDAKGKVKRIPTGTFSERLMNWKKTA